MKTYFSLRLCIIFLLVFSLKNLGFGQYNFTSTEPVATLGSIKNDGSGTGGLTVYIMDDSCANNIKLRVKLVNVDDFIEIDDEIFLTLSENYPPMYLAYSINNGPIAYEHVDYFTPDESSNYLYSIWEKTSYDFYISNECNQLANSPSLDYVNIPVYVELVTPAAETPTGYIQYPACLFTGSNQIFSCEYTDCAGDGIDGDNTSGHSSRPDGPSQSANSRNDDDGCNNEAIALGNFSYHVVCRSCLGDGKVPTRGINASLGHGIDDGISPEYNIYPNPFLNAITVQWNSDLLINQMTLQNTSGNILMSWSESDLIDVNNLDINTLAIENGIYILSIYTIDEVSTFKLIKQ